MKYIIFLILISTFILQCAGNKAVTKEAVKPLESDTMVMEETEFRDLDSLVVTPEGSETEPSEDQTNSIASYRASYHRTWDLLHTSLRIEFDWQQEHVSGKANLKLVPLFYTMDSLVLDAKTFDIHSISSKNKSLPFTYDGNLITIRLDRPFSKKDTLFLDIDYTAKPSANSTGGSAAITDDNGLYFIDPRNTDPSLPIQLWSQGETENNSRWFPTIDKPNERMTHDITLTVPDSMLTLSNGLKTTSVKNNDGTRSDTWVMDQPHAPYLVMIAAGVFAKVSDTWKGMNVDYYVEPQYAPYAKEIFNHTPEMLSFFSDKLGIHYPWKKFAQIIVKKYVSGAMENTTAVVFGDFIQKTHRELIDDKNDYIIAHEMMHHWFGDYVTSESWANLTLNEGFANYSEYLWFEHKYGKYEADRHREDELMGYLSSVSFGKAHNLIDFHYTDRESMFDAHSYNKGGLTLHMLRHYVGDEAFYAALNLYLRKHAYKSVEVHDLRLAFEEVTGEDLNWFFNQWYLDDGHPALTYTTQYDATTKTLKISLHQTQKKSYPSVFVLPIDVDIHHQNETIERKRIWMNERSQDFILEVDQKPLLTVLDPNRVLLTEWDEPSLTTAEYQRQWKSCNSLQLKLNAMGALTEEKEYAVIWREALKNPFWYIRLRALDYIPTLKEADKELLSFLATGDPHSQVRAAAIRILSDKKINTQESFYENIISADSAYVSISEALKALTALNPSKASALAKNLQQEKNNVLQEGIAEAIASTDDPENLDFFERKLSEDPSSAPMIMDQYLDILLSQNISTLYAKSGFLFKQAIRKDIDKNAKYYFVKGIFEIKDEIVGAALNVEDSAKRIELETKAKMLKSWIQEIKEKESDPQVKSLLGQFN